MSGILKFVSGKFWPMAQDHIDETYRRGPSVRIANPPDLEAPYPIAFVHPRGTFRVGNFSLFDLYTEMTNEGHTVLAEEEAIIEGLPSLSFVNALERLMRSDKKEYERIEEKYGIVWHYAVAHYSYITSVQVVVGQNGEHMDKVEAMRARGIDVEPVIVVKEEEDD